MSPKIFVLCIVFVLGLSMVHSDGDCGPNATWKDCGSPCATTCNSRFTHGACPAVCKADCFCNKGYLKESDGTCVKQCKLRK